MRYPAWKKRDGRIGVVPARSRSPVVDKCGASLTRLWTKAQQDFEKEQQKVSRERTFVRSSQASSPRRLGHTLILHRLQSPYHRHPYRRFLTAEGTPNASPGNEKFANNVLPSFSVASWLSALARAPVLDSPQFYLDSNFSQQREQP